MPNRKNGEETVKGVLTFIVLAIMILWLSSLIPEQNWMYDRTPMCAEGTSAVLEGKTITCRTKQ